MGLSPFGLPLKPWFFYDRQSLLHVLSGAPQCRADLYQHQEEGARVMERAQ